MVDSASGGSVRRVLLLARGGALDGSQRQLIYLVRGLDRSRFEPVVLLDRHGPLEDVLRQSGTEVHAVAMRPWRSFPVGLLRYVDGFRMAGIGRRRGACLVHASDKYRSNYMQFIARRLGLPGVLHIRGPMPPRSIRKFHVAGATAVIAIARRYREELLAERIAPDRVEVIDDAVDMETFRPGLDAEEVRGRFSPDGRLLVGLVGRIDAHKRVIEFMEAVAPLARQAGRRATFLVIGRHKEKPYCQAVMDAARRLDLGAGLVFTGHFQDMPRMITALDLLVTMSGGSVMFEAMACAKPVLSVRGDGRHSDHTRHDETAWCLTTDRPEPVTEALARLIEDRPLRDRLGQAGLAQARQHLSPQALANKTQSLYDRLLASHRGP